MISNDLSKISKVLFKNCPTPFILIITCYSAMPLPFITVISHTIQDVASPMLENIKKFGFKRETLRRTRDLLLPKLISGAIDVSEFPEPSELTTA